MTTTTAAAAVVAAASCDPGDSHVAITRTSWTAHGRADAVFFFVSGCRFSFRIVFRVDFYLYLLFNFFFNFEQNVFRPNGWRRSARRPKTVYANYERSSAYRETRRQRPRGGRKKNTQKPDEN